MTHSSQNQKSNLNIPATVIATLQRANGSFFTKFATDRRFPIEFDVRYPGELLPSDIVGSNVFQSGDKIADLSKDPVYASIKRLDMQVVVFQTKNDLTQQSGSNYALRILKRGRMYSGVYLSNGSVQESGDLSVLNAAQHDREFAKYVSFVTKQDNLQQISLKPWQKDLDETMDTSSKLDMFHSVLLQSCTRK